MSPAAFSLAVTVAAAVAFAALERRVPADPGQRLLRPGFWTDLLACGLAQSYAAPRLRASRGRA